MTCTLREPDRMNLLGLMLHSILGRRLADPAAATLADRIRGDVLVQAGSMQVTLRFQPEGIQILRSPGGARPRAAIRGTLRALLDVALGRRWLPALLAGRIRARGMPLTLWRLLRLLRP